MHAPLHSPSAPPPSFTQSPYPPRSLVCDERTHPHRPRLVVSHSTCPPLSSSSPREHLCNRSCSNKHTHTPGKTPCFKVQRSKSTRFLTGPSPAMGGIQIPRWLGSDPLSAWWLGLAPVTLEFWVRFPNERNQGKQAHPVLN
jgi:hypothetical protein